MYSVAQPIAILKIAGFRYGGLLGIAAATSVYYLLNCTLLYLLLVRRTRDVL